MSRLEKGNVAEPSFIRFRAVTTSSMFDPTHYPQLLLCDYGQTVFDTWSLSVPSLLRYGNPYVLICQIWSALVFLLHAHNDRERDSINNTHRESMLSVDQPRLNLSVGAREQFSQRCHHTEFDGDLRSRTEL